MAESTLPIYLNDVCAPESGLVQFPIVIDPDDADTTLNSILTSAETAYGTLRDSFAVAVSVDGSYGNAVSLQHNGKVVATANASSATAARDTAHFVDIIKVFATPYMTVGISSTGQLQVACQASAKNLCFRGWSDVTKISVAGEYVAGIKADKTLVCQPSTYFGAAAAWTDLVDVWVTSYDAIYGKTSAGKILYAGTDPGNVGLSLATAWPASTVKIAGCGALILGLVSDGTLRSCGKGSAAVHAALREYSNVADISCCAKVIALLKTDKTVVAFALDTDHTTFYPFNSVTSWTGVKQVVSMVHNGGSNRVISALCENGTVLSTDDSIQSTVSSWTNIKQLAAGEETGLLLVGLKNDGTVVTAGTGGGRLTPRITAWSGMSSLLLGTYLAVGYRSDNTLQSIGIYGSDKHACTSFLYDWDDIATVVTYGTDGIVALRKDGTVACWGQGAWNVDTLSGALDVVALPTLSKKKTKIISDAAQHLVALLNEDKTVSIFGISTDVNSIHAVVAGWSNIKQVTTSSRTIFGLKEDGTVVSAGQDPYESIVNTWSAVAEIAASTSGVYARKSDGTVLYAGSNDYGEGTVSSWTDVAALRPGYRACWAIRTDGTLLKNGKATLNWAGFVDIFPSPQNSYAVALYANGTVSTDLCGASYNAALSLHGPSYRAKAICGFRSDFFCLGLDGYVRQTTTSSDAIYSVSAWSNIKKIATSDSYGYANYNTSVLGLTNDGNMLIIRASGNSNTNLDTIGSWTGIVDFSFSISGEACIGLKADGTCVAQNTSGPINVSSWAQVIAVAAFSNIVAGLRVDGTVICSSSTITTTASTWSDIVALASVSGWEALIGLKKNGTLVGVGVTPPAGDNFIQVAGGYYHALALRADGTVAGCGSNSKGELNGLSNWRDIVKVVASCTGNSIGIRKNGTVVAVGVTTNGILSAVSTWTDVVDVAAQTGVALYGLRADGTILYSSTYATNYPTVLPAVAAKRYPTLHFKTPAGAEIPFTVQRYTKKNGTTQVCFTLLLDLSTLTSPKYVNLCYGEPTQTATALSALPGGVTLPALANVFSEQNHVGWSRQDDFHWRDVLLRTSDGRIIPFSRTLRRDGANITGVDLRACLRAALGSDMYICYGSAPKSDPAARPSEVSYGVTTPLAETTPTPGTAWDYSTFGASYDVLGGDGIKLSENLQYVHTGGFLLASDGISAGETRDSLLTVNSALTETVKGAEARSNSAAMQTAVADAAKLAESSAGVKILAELVTDAAALAEPVRTAVLLGLNTLVDAVKTADTPNMSAILNFLATDTVKQSESLANLGLLLALTQDGVVTPELASSVATFQALAMDTAVAPEQIMFGSAFVEALSDGISVAEALSTLGILFSTGIDALCTVSEEVSGALEHTEVSAEQVKGGGQTSAGFSLELSAADGLASVDGALAGLLTSAQLLDGARGSETQQALINSVKVAVDSLLCGESRSAVLSSIRTVADAVTGQELTMGGMLQEAATADGATTRGARSAGLPAFAWAWGPKP